MSFCRFAPFLLLLMPIISTSQTPKFAERDLETEAGPVKLIRADFNNDSVPDIAIANQDAGTVSVFLMNAAGEFQSRHDFAVGQNPTALVAVDFNHDRKLDLLVTSADPNELHSLAMLFGNGDGTFKPAVFQNVGTKPTTIAAADFNRDGHWDFVSGWVAPNDNPDTGFGRPNQMYFFYGNGRGGFSNLVITNPTGEFQRPGESDRILTKLAVGDFNKDGWPDVAFIEGGGGTGGKPLGDVYVLLNNHDETFRQMKVADESEPTDISVSDVDQDGVDDIITTRYGCGNQDECGGETVVLGVDYFRGLGDGTFAAPQSESSNVQEFLGYLTDPIAVDMNRDGLKDIVVFAHTSGTGITEAIVYFQGREGKIFDDQLGATKKIYLTNLTGGDFGSGTVANFNLDHRMDMVLASGNGVASVLLNTTQNRGCSVPPSPRELPVCLPAFTIITSPVQFSVNPKDPLPIEAIKIYVDGVAKFTTKDDVLSTRLNMPLGDHHVEVKAWDRTGNFSQAFDLTIVDGCAVPGLSRSVNICSPANGTAVSNPVHFRAIVNDVAPVNMQIYIDGVVKFASSDPIIDTSLNLSTGNHRITVKGWDAAGQFSQTIQTTVH